MLQAMWQINNQRTLAPQASDGAHQLQCAPQTTGLAVSRVSVTWVRLLRQHVGGSCSARPFVPCCDCSQQVCCRGSLLWLYGTGWAPHAQMHFALQARGCSAISWSPQSSTPRQHASSAARRAVSCASDDLALFLTLFLQKAKANSCYMSQTKMSTVQYMHCVVLPHALALNSFKSRSGQQA